MVRRWSDGCRFVMSASIAMSMLTGTAAWAFPPVKPAEIDAHRQALCTEGGASVEEFDAIASAYLRELDYLDAASDGFWNWSQASWIITGHLVSDETSIGDDREITRLWQKERSRISSRYFDRLEALNGADLEVAHDLVRTHLRHSYLERSSTPSQTATPDLVALVDSVVTDADELAAIAEVMATYKHEMHALLLRQADPSRFDTGQQYRAAREERDAERMESLLVERYTLEAQKRELSLRTLDQIVSRLSTDSGRGLRSEAERILYGYLFPKQPIDYKLEAALARDDLTPGQRRDLEGSVRTLERRRSAARGRLMELIDSVAAVANVRRRAALSASHSAGLVGEWRTQENLLLRELFETYARIGDDLKEDVDAVIGDG